MTPPATAPPVGYLKTTLPSSLSNAYTLPPMSPAKITPPAVGVMPETTGASAWKRQRTLPEAASTDVIQPLGGGSDTNLKVPPMNISPGLNSDFPFLLMSAHQSTAPTTIARCSTS